MLLRRLPDTVYKYLGPERVDVLRSFQVRFTPPNGFNDPFESLPRVRRPNRESVGKKLEPGENLDDLMRRAIPYFQEQGPRHVLDAASQVFGVFALAQVTRHPLLWGHYASGHRGFAIGFDRHHDWFHRPKRPQPPIDGVRSVLYRWRRPKVDIGYAEDFSTAQIAGLAKGMLFTKHRAWKYEREWRLVRPLADADHVIRPIDEEVHLFAFPREAVAEIIAGARASSDLVEQLQEVSSELGVPLYQASLSDSSYGLRLARVGTA